MTMDKRLLVVLALALGGCVPSLHPLYTDKDLIFDPALLGQWSPADGQGSWTFRKTGEKEYQLDAIDKDGKRGRFQVHMVKLDGRVFLDLFPMERTQKEDDFYELHFVPTHTFFRVKQIEPKLQMAYLDPEWIGKYLPEHPDAIRHEKVHGGAVLTAQPKELQAFVLKHQKDGFHDMDPLTRKPGTKKQ
jgi:hypothetical protein